MRDPNAPLPAPRLEGPELSPELEVDEYESFYKTLDHPSYATRAWIGRYSRGDDFEALREAFLEITEKVRKTQMASRERYGQEIPPYRCVDDEGLARYAGLYRDGLALLSIASCLGVRGEPALLLRDACTRGDTLIELLLGQLTGERAATTRACFPRNFGGLYAAHAAPAERRALIVSKYLAEWSDVWIDGFGLKDHYQKVGLWCFEAAGVVAALGIDDSSFIDHPQYPKDLVRCFREQPREVVSVRLDETITPPPPPKPKAAPPWPKTRHRFDQAGLRRLLELIGNGAELPIAAGWHALVTSLATSEPGEEKKRLQRGAIEEGFRALAEADGAILLDWKAGDQVAPSCRALLGVDFAAAFRWKQGPKQGVKEGLSAFHHHAAQYGYSVVHLESMSDSYWATVAPDEKVPELVALAGELGVKASVQGD